MRAFACEIAGEIALHSRVLILLDGPMGAGKTQFTRFLVDALGGSETASPSFAIHHAYPIPRGVVHHFDLFRLENEDDLESTGFWDFLGARDGIILIEWSRRLEEIGLSDALPKAWPRLSLELFFAGANPESRVIAIART